MKLLFFLLPLAVWGQPPKVVYHQLGFTATTGFIAHSVQTSFSWVPDDRDRFTASLGMEIFPRGEQRPDIEVLPVASLHYFWDDYSTYRRLFPAAGFTYSNDLLFEGGVGYRIGSVSLTLLGRLPVTWLSMHGIVGLSLSFTPNLYKP